MTFMVRRESNHLPSRQQALIVPIATLSRGVGERSMCRFERIPRYGHRFCIVVAACEPRSSLTGERADKTTPCCRPLSALKGRGFKSRRKNSRESGRKLARKTVPAPSPFVDDF